MELIRRHLASQPSGYAAYLTLQRALMRHHIARGGTAEDFCKRLSPVYRARYGVLAEMASAPAPTSTDGFADDAERAELRQAA